MTGNEALLTFALIAGGFLLGGVMFSRALPKLLTGKDVCALRADKNPGAANVFAVCGVPMGLLCLALDMFKAYLPVSLAAQYLDTQSVWFALALAAPVLGHAVGVFNGFHGGKCIASAFGAMLALALTGVSPAGSPSRGALHLLLRRRKDPPAPAAQHTRVRALRRERRGILFAPRRGRARARLRHDRRDRSAASHAALLRRRRRKAAHFQLRVLNELDIVNGDGSC